MIIETFECSNILKNQNKQTAHRKKIIELYVWKSYLLFFFELAATFLKLQPG
jgi:hypothetical protein